MYEERPSVQKGRRVTCTLGVPYLTCANSGRVGDEVRSRETGGYDLLVVLLSRVCTPSGRYGPDGVLGTRRGRGAG